MKRSTFAAGFLCAVLAGCAAGPGQYLKAGYVPPRSVAVLPLNNRTTDIDGADAVRFWLNFRLAEKKGYRTIPLEVLDPKLKELGITDGGQLAAIAPQRLGEKLGAEAVVFGDLLEFSNQAAGALSVRRVRARLRMVDCRTGERLWEAEGEGANSEAPLPPSQAGLKNLGVQLADKAANSPLRPEIWDMVWSAIEGLPAGR